MREFRERAKDPPALPRLFPRYFVETGDARFYEARKWPSKVKTEKALPSSFQGTRILPPFPLPMPLRPLLYYNLGLGGRRSLSLASLALLCLFSKAAGFFKEKQSFARKGKSVIFIRGLPRRKANRHPANSCFCRPFFRPTLKGECPASIGSFLPF